jgi:hypothetical protein
LHRKRETVHNDRGNCHAAAGERKPDPFPSSFLR